ncbi:hypothetical protein EIJ81_13460 [Aliivibrio salmonicida]|uniref:Exported protein n=1 Tax=Aliivibrio salmonicida (strain LFI1238) TaxID=316275 RepID=B6EJF6_ALISL|nr:hypothetical protein [Aliivibrio salmonicida]AZL85473.1 hypothetical protein EIJ81_13460 [Aliivibrio salmonicida]CAQ80010.1 putative exported protein [Aliivibrio salmonicida LFI1238]
MNSFLRFLLLSSLPFSALSVQPQYSSLSVSNSDSFILAKSCIDSSVVSYFEEKGITPDNSHIQGYGSCFNVPKYKVKHSSKKDLKHYLGEGCSDPALIKLLKSEGIDPRYYQIESSERCQHQNIS